MKHLLGLLFLTQIPWVTAYAQTVTQYKTVYSSGGYMYETDTLDSEMSVPYGVATHTITAGFYLKNPGGSSTPFSATQRGDASQYFDPSASGYISIAEVGTYTAQQQDEAMCTIAGIFLTDDVFDTFIPPPELDAVTNSATGGNSFSVDSSGTMVLWGYSLACENTCGESEVSITFSPSDSNVQTSWSYLGDQQINLNITVGVGATAGTHTVCVATPFPPESCNTFMVGDGTPVITGISPSTWTAGSSVPFTITGSNFGSVTPGNPNSALTISPSVATFSVQSWTDTIIQATAAVSPSATGSASLFVTSTGFGNGFQSGGGSQPSQGGGNNGVQIVGPPLITSVSESPFVAGQTYQNVEVTGTNFGTACPTASISNAGSNSMFYVSAATCTPTSFQGTLTLDQAATSGTLNATFTSGKATYNLSIVAINIQLTQSGNIAISTDGKYSENATVVVTAVRADTGAKVSNFTGTVDIAEDGTAIYAQNGGALPSSVDIQTGGSQTFVAISLAGPKSATAGPDPAKIKTTNLPLYKNSDLQISQWVDTGTIQNSKATGTVPDWLQARSRDLFAQATGNNKTVISTVSSYVIMGVATAAGQAPATHSETTQVTINPYYLGGSEMRTDSAFGSLCGTTISKGLTNTFYHEGRHAYQYQQATLPGNDVDQDFLVNEIGIAPTTIFLDTTAKRTVCNETANTTMQEAYLGDSIPDAFANVDYALEEDAATFAQN